MHEDVLLVEPDRQRRLDAFRQCVNAFSKSTVLAVNQLSDFALAADSDEERMDMVDMLLLKSIQVLPRSNTFMILSVPVFGRFA